MTSLNEITKWHPRSLQKWLREIDENDLVLVMPYLPKDVHHLILENLSSRIRKNISESLKETTPVSHRIIDRAKERILEIANDMIDMGELSEPGDDELEDLPRKTLLPASLPSDNTHQLIETLTILGKFANERGLLSLEEALLKINDPFLKEAIQLIVDDTDSDVVEEILRNRVRAIINHKEMLYNLIIEGILGIQDGNSSWTLELRLKSHLPPDMGESKKTM